MTAAGPGGSVAGAIAAGLSVAGAGLIAVAGYTSGWILAAAVALSVLGLAAGWGPLLHLPHPAGTSVVVAVTGIAGLVVAALVRDQSRPLEAFAAVVALAVLAAFGHELARRDGRPDVVESITGTLAGQVMAILAAGWLLLSQPWQGTVTQTEGRHAVLVAAVVVAAARLASALPWGLAVTGWVGFALGVGAAGVTSVLVDGVGAGRAITTGVTVAGVAAAIDRLLGAELEGDRRSVALLAASAAPVAAAGTVAYAAARIMAG